MPILAPLMGLLIAFAVGIYIFLPYFWEGEQPQEAPPKFDDDTGREKLMTDLANLEYDFRSGKLDEAGYKQLRTSLETRLSQLQGEETQHG